VKLIRIKDGEKELACVVADDLSGVSIEDNAIDLIYQGKRVQLLFTHHTRAITAYINICLALESVEQTANNFEKSITFMGGLEDG